MTLNEALLREGIVEGGAKDAIQFVVSAGAEYGLGALTLPAYGAGLAVGPTVETMVDSLFTAEEVADAIQAVSSVGEKLGEFKGLWDEAREAYGGNLSGYYDALVKMVRMALEEAGDGAKDAVEDIAEKLRDCLLYTSPSPRDRQKSRMPSSA